MAQLEALELRPATAGDRSFLLTLYASTRADELALVPWDDAAKEAFVLMQFEAQCSHYALHYPEAAHDVVLVDGEPAGRLYVDRRAREIRIVDIALLPGYRGQEIGSALLRDLMAEADASGKRLTIHVERLNPALGLYERLGFSVAEDKGVYLFLERIPVRLNT